MKRMIRISVRMEETREVREVWVLSPHPMRPIPPSSLFSQSPQDSFAVHTTWIISL